MGCRVSFTETAAAELEDILAFLANDYRDPEYAAQLLDGFEQKAAAIAEHPGMCQVVDEPLAASYGYRKFMVKNYCFLYAIASDGNVEIKHVFHEARDYAGLL